MLNESQLKIRESTIGASESAAALGISKYKTPLDVYLEKIGMKESDFDNDAMFWGRKFEEPIAEKYKESKGKDITSVDTKISEEHPFMSCNLDRYIPEDNAAIECKNVGFFNEDEWGEQGSDEIPTEYLVQVAHQAIVWNLSYVDLAALGNRYDYRVYRYERNSKLESKIIKGLEMFWVNNVEKHIAPEPKTMSDIIAMRKDESDDIFMADEEMGELYQTLKEKKIAEKEIAKEIEALKVKILSKMGNSTTAAYEGKKIITFKKQDRKILDTSKVIATIGDMSDYYKTTTSSVFRIY